MQKTTKIPPYPRCPEQKNHNLTVPIYNVNINLKYHSFKYIFKIILEKIKQKRIKSSFEQMRNFPAQSLILLHLIGSFSHNFVNPALAGR